MRERSLKTLVGVALACFMVLGTYTLASAQGRGRGGGGGGGVGAGGGGGRPSGVGRPESVGRPDDPFSVGSSRSGGRADVGMDRAAEVRRNPEIRTDSRRPDDRELAANSQRYRALAGRLGYASPDAMRAAYDSLAGEKVTFGEFVASHMLARNLSRRGLGDQTTLRNDLLTRLSAGDSIGEALRDMGLSKSDAKEEEKRVKRQLKESQGQ